MLHEFLNVSLGAALRWGHGNYLICGIRYDENVKHYINVVAVPAVKSARPLDTFFSNVLI